MKLCAAIVETRNIPDLENIIQRHMDFLPEETDLHIWVGQDTKYLAEKFPDATVKFIGEMSIEKYNRLLTSPNFWNLYCGYDRILIFQSDSMILRPGIEEFEPYCFIGSPWRFQEFGSNGGFSLRNPRTMKTICETYPFDITQGNEDIYFCNVMHNKKIGRLAPREVCERFGTEAIFRLNTFGFHAIDQWQTKEECEQIKNQYGKI